MLLLCLICETVCSLCPFHAAALPRSFGFSFVSDLSFLSFISDLFFGISSLLYHRTLLLCRCAASYASACCLQVLECVLAMIILHKYILNAVLVTILVATMVHKALQRYQQAERLAGYAHWPRLVPYVCRGIVHAMAVRQLVPGDVIVVQPGVAVCDAVLLQGGCLCEQSTLTGEVSVHLKLVWSLAKLSLQLVGTPMSPLIPAC